ncbi:MAG: septation protein IspZ [Pseudomonadota bacterium]
MAKKPINGTLRAALEFGPIAAFLLGYLIFRNDTFTIAGTEYTGFVAVTAAFVPVFLLSMAALWLLTRRVARIQIVVAVMLTLFGGLSVWFNDPQLFKMKPTAIYLTLGTLLGIGLLRGQSWLKLVMEEMIPLREKGWMLLTKRMTALFFASAAANEVVWRMQSEAFWVIFETLAMPVVILVFFVFQFRLFVDHATLDPGKKKKKRRRKPQEPQRTGPANKSPAEG